MVRDEAVIIEINELWLPVYPYMARYLLAEAGVSGGRILDLGPFAGGIALSLLAADEGSAATVVDESEAVLRWAEERAALAGCRSRLATRLGRVDPLREADSTFDLVVVRGVFFFLTASLLQQVRRLLRPGGFAWVGGGYGPTTPEKVIAPIAERSKFLNEALGKRRITPGDAGAIAASAGLSECTTVATKGGLWLEIRA